MSVFQPWLPAQDSPEILVNENFQALEHMAVYAKDATTTVGLTWGYIGGRWGGFVITAGTLTLAANNTLYVTVDRATGAVSVSSSDAAWADLGAHARVYKLETGAATVTSVEDHRGGLGGVHGISGVPAGGNASATVVSVAVASRVLTGDDSGAYLRFTAVGAKTLLVDVAATFAPNQEFHIANRSESGDLTIAPSGVTLFAPKGGTLILEPGDTVTIKLISSTAADVFGSTKGAT